MYRGLGIRKIHPSSWVTFWHSLLMNDAWENPQSSPTPGASDHCALRSCLLLVVRQFRTLAKRNRRCAGKCFPGLSACTDGGWHAGEALCATSFLPISMLQNGWRELKILQRVAANEWNNDAHTPSLQLMPFSIYFSPPQTERTSRNKLLTLQFAHNNW